MWFCFRVELDAYKSDCIEGNDLILGPEPEFSACNHSGKTHTFMYHSVEDHVLVKYFGSLPPRFYFKLEFVAGKKVISFFQNNRIVL